MPYHSMQGHLSIIYCNSKGKTYNLDYLNTCAKMSNQSIHQYINHHMLQNHLITGLTLQSSPTLNTHGTIPIPYQMVPLV